MAAAKQQRIGMTIKSIWGLAKSPELRLDKDDLYAIIYRETGHEHMRDLTPGDISRVCRVLYTMKDQANGGKTVYHPKRTDEGGNDATVEQRRRIYHLCQQLGWTDVDQINGFARRMCRVDRVEWLNPRQCRVIIEALKKMIERKEADDGQSE